MPRLGAVDSFHVALILDLPSGSHDQFVLYLLFELTYRKHSYPKPK
jgi:hypothetical protein